MSPRNPNSDKPVKAPKGVNSTKPYSKPCKLLDSPFQRYRPCKKEVMCSGGSPEELRAINGRSLDSAMRAVLGKAAKLNFLGFTLNPKP